MTHSGSITLSSGTMWASTGLLKCVSGSRTTQIFPFYTFHLILLSWILLRNYFQLGGGRYMNENQWYRDPLLQALRKLVATWVSWPVRASCTTQGVSSNDAWTGRLLPVMWMRPSGQIGTGGLMPTVLFSVCTEIPFFLCIFVCWFMFDYEKGRPTLRHFTKREMAHSPESLSIILMIVFSVLHFSVL